MTRRRVARGQLGVLVEENQRAVRGAPIAILVVAVVALLSTGRVEAAIATNKPHLVLADCRAPVAGEGVAVVTFLAGVEDTVATGRQHTMAKLGCIPVGVARGRSDEGA